MSLNFSEHFSVERADLLAFRKPRKNISHKLTLGDQNDMFKLDLVESTRAKVRKTQMYIIIRLVDQTVQLLSPGKRHSIVDCYSNFSIVSLVNTIA